MPREIKFRAWNPESKRMVDLQEITPLALSDSMNSQLAFQGISGLFIPFNDDWPLMQYTGLKDCKGQEIYEGDILQWLDTRKKVEATGGGWNPFISDMQTDGSWHYEVIGNIYENPELLEAKDV